MQTDPKGQDQPRFKLDQIVVWKTHGWNWKTGRIVQVVDAGELPKQPPMHAMTSALYRAKSRDHVSYLIAVPRLGRKWPLLYWPPVARIERIR